MKFRDNEKIYVLYDKFSKVKSMVLISDNVAFVIGQCIEYIIAHRLPPNMFEIYEVNGISFDCVSDSSDMLCERYNFISNFRIEEANRLRMTIEKTKEEMRIKEGVDISGVDKGGVAE